MGSRATLTWVDRPALPPSSLQDNSSSLDLSFFHVTCIYSYPLLTRLGEKSNEVVYTIIITYNDTVCSRCLRILAIFPFIFFIVIYRKM